MSKAMTVIGLMSGTSMDGVDAAILVTDGETIESSGSTFAMKYSAEEREVLRQAATDAQGWQKGTPAPQSVAKAEALVTDKHTKVVHGLLQFARKGIDLIGFHGQTILHRPEQAWTVQIGDSAALAAATGIPVVGDFRIADVEAGGQGAPLAPLYHKALIDSLPEGMLPGPGPVVVVNMGGVGNVTYIDGDTVLAFDTGPANGPIDDWIRHWSGRGYDKGGAVAATGRVDEARVAKALKHAYFDQVPPKSLDRQDFTRDMAEGLSMHDGAATLTAFSAICVGKARAHFPKEPVAWIVCGGGRHNPTLLHMISASVPAIVYTAEDMGWRGDHIEAEAFAFLAARSERGLPLTLPTTTGVAEPTTGGQLYAPPPLTGTQNG